MAENKVSLSFPFFPYLRVLYNGVADYKTGDIESLAGGCAYYTVVICLRGDVTIYDMLAVKDDIVVDLI